MFCKDTIEPVTLELLKNLQSIDILKGFYLAGGTSLAMQIGHRKSIDLDLFTNEDFEVNKLLEYLEENYQFSMNYTSKNTLKGCLNGVNVDFIAHKYPLVSNPLIIEGASLLSIEDIAAMKLNAISGNGTRSKDFVDIYFILKQFTLNQIIDYYKTKYDNRNLLHVIKSLNYFEDISTVDWPVMIIENKLSISKVKKSITSHISKFSKNLL